MKIDIFSHILPPKYLESLNKKTKLAEYRTTKNRANVDLDMRLKLMERNPDVLQVLTISITTIEAQLALADSIELSRTANDEIAEILVKHPDKFIAGVATLPLDDIDAALKETDRAITQLGLKGVQLLARIKGEQIDDPKFKPLYEKMSKYDLPIWLHPISDEMFDESVFGWPFATANAMRRLVVAGVFQDYPKIKFIVHHCGAMAPYFAGRIRWLFPLAFEMDNPVRYWAEDFRKFYNDTATYGITSALMCGYDFFGADHILFGTDAPLGPEYGLTTETIESVQRMAIPDEDREKIFKQNAIKLLKMAV